MNLVDAGVVSNQPAFPGANLMWLHSTELAQTAQPGQFVMLRCSYTWDPLLRRALSIHRIQPQTGDVALLYGGGGAGTEFLRRRLAGDTVNVLGPLGNGYTTHPATRNLLLIGVSWGLSPLIALAEQAVNADRAVTLLAGAPTAAQVVPGELVPPQVELVVATEDGSLGAKGLVTELAGQYWGWADQVYACGPMAFYKGLSEATARLWPRKTVQVLADMPMACGVGACFGCTLETRRGLVVTCREGPAVLLHDLLF